MVEGIKEGQVARDRAIAMLIIFVFNIMFWMFFEQAGSSFNFLAEKIVNRNFGGWIFPVAWFQSINPIGILALAPVFAWLWIKLGRFNPSIPRKFGLGLSANGMAFLLLMFALSKLVSPAGMIPFWTLVVVYLIQTVGELCLSPIGLSMVTKLAPVRLVGFGHGRLVPVDGNRQQPVGHLRQQRQRRNRNDDDLGAGRVHVRLLGADQRRRVALGDRALDPEADARSEMSRRRRRSHEVYS